MTAITGVLAALWYAGCSLDVTGRPAGAQGAVRVTVAPEGESATQSGGRTAIPANPGFTYTLVFTAAGKDTVTAALNGKADIIPLDTGAWELTVTGKQGDVPAAVSDPVSLTVTAAVTTAVSVTVHPALNGAGGSFRYVFSAEAGVTYIPGRLTPRYVGNMAQGEISLLTGDGAEHTVTAAPGYYLLTVEANKGIQRLVRREVVHIYPATETYKAYDLRAEDFASAIYLEGELSGGISGYTPERVLAYGDAACAGEILGDGGVSGTGKWYMAVSPASVEAAGGSLWFRVSLLKDGTDYYTKPVGAAGPFPDTGRTGIKLPVEGEYTVTFNPKGGEIAGSAAVSVPKNGTLTPPDAIRAGYKFAGWYDDQRDRLFDTATRVTGSITVSAKWAAATAAAFKADLQAASGGGSAGAPVRLAAGMSLAGGGLADLLPIIAEAGKYAALDLSACTLPGTAAFSPGSGPGADKVTALVLPAAAQTLGVFSAFTALTSLTAPGAASIGAGAFAGCAALVELKLPAAPPSLAAGVFAGTASSDDRLNVRVPAGTVSAYTAKWGVASAQTPAKSNTARYGANHKSVYITDQP
jgi:uncharacterized repeat protein (TIGR02543 family)